MTQKISVISLALVFCTLLAFAQTNESKYLILINSANKIPSDWESRIEYLCVKDFEEKDCLVEKQTFESFKKLQSALSRKKIFIELAQNLHKNNNSIMEEIKSGLGIDFILLGQKSEKSIKQVHSLLAKYGFILRYPKGKELITGVAHCDFHIRYVGIIAAKEISESHLSLEEYIGLKSMLF